MQTTLNLWQHISRPHVRVKFPQNYYNLFFMCIKNSMYLRLVGHMGSCTWWAQLWQIWFEPYSWSEINLFPLLVSVHRCFRECATPTDFKMHLSSDKPFFSPILYEATAKLEKMSKCSVPSLDTPETKKKRKEKERENPFLLHAVLIWLKKNFWRKKRDGEWKENIWNC